MPDSPPTTSRQVWLIMWGALTAAPVIYVVLAQVIAAPAEPSASLPLLRTAFVGLAVVAFGAGTFLISRAAGPEGFPPGPTAPGAPDLAAPATFQLRSIVAMALIESVAVYGFVLFMLGGSRLQVLPCAAASIAGMVGVVLPAGLAYWRRWELAASGGRPPALD
jgi:hypothetical protein